MSLISMVFMEDLKLLSLADLIDLLIDQTRYHTYSIVMGASPEQFRQSREILSKLQSEIKLRKSVERSIKLHCLHTTKQLRQTQPVEPCIFCHGKEIKVNI